MPNKIYTWSIWLFQNASPEVIFRSVQFTRKNTFINFKSKNLNFFNNYI